MARKPAFPTAVMAAVVLAVPFVCYAFTVWRFAVNVPYWDDFSVILKPVAAVFRATGVQEQLSILFKPNAGHLPLLTRVVAVLQVCWSGAIDFRRSLWFANLGWLATTALLMAYASRQWQLRGLALLPIPCLMLSIVHWEAMDFTTPAWQMYWGSALLPLVCLLATVHGRPLLAASSYVMSLFFSSGALALLPLAIGYWCWRRQWRCAMVFSVPGAAMTTAFLWCNPPGAYPVDPPSVAVVLHFIPAFMGNVIGNGSWILSRLAAFHWWGGLVVIALGIHLCRQSRACDAAKLVFVYVLLLACMAVYLRGAAYSYVVSRYAPFALLCSASLYAALAYGWQVQARPWRGTFLVASLAVSVLLWGYSYYRCLDTLAANWAMRLASAQQFLRGEGLGEKLLWDAHYGEVALQEAEAAGVFDAAVWR